ncbi:MAG: rod shape-determining protein MreD [Bacteroidetes bacterium HGW-Bacteroidetes-1]|jgi:hypothetical protein|nr:MAG: rod shape-determining protein MreD [Bacteroidetes bacterium HGW-Bacteroidetes-1]
MNKVLINIIRFIGLILLQVLVLNNIRFGGYINPYVYILFVMMLPFAMPGWMLLLAGFGMGLVVDMFMSTPGLHAGAGVFIAFARPFVVQLATGSKEPENVSDPSLSKMGSRWWFSYTVTLVFAHHFILFFLESFSFSQFWSTLWRIIISVTFTEILILLLSLFFIDRKSR